MGAKVWKFLHNVPNLKYILKYPEIKTSLKEFEPT